MLTLGWAKRAGVFVAPLQSHLPPQPPRFPFLTVVEGEPLTPSSSSLLQLDLDQTPHTSAKVSPSETIDRNDPDPATVLERPEDPIPFPLQARRRASASI